MKVTTEDTMTTMRDVALGKAAFCLRWARRDPQHADTHRRHAQAWHRIYLATL
jgi:hypothetical protein